MTRDEVFEKYYYVISRRFSRDEFETDVHEAFNGKENNPKFQKAYNLAWEEGHSNGYTEVLLYLQDLMELIE
jgi:hypothetical protein